MKRSYRFMKPAFLVVAVGGVLLLLMNAGCRRSVPEGSLIVTQVPVGEPAAGAP
jgi:hypothetical protein